MVADPSWFDEAVGLIGTPLENLNEGVASDCPQGELPGYFWADPLEVIRVVTAKIAKTGTASRPSNREAMRNPLAAPVERSSALISIRSPEIPT